MPLTGIAGNLNGSRAFSQRLAQDASEPANPEDASEPANPEDTTEPANPGTEEASEANVCELCGEIHDTNTLYGFIIDLIHDIIFVVRGIVNALTAV